MNRKNDNRRDLLKKLGAVAGFSIFGAGSASAEPDTLGSVQFSEVSLTHEVEDSRGNLFHIAIDELPTHVVDEEAGNLYLSDFVTDEELRLFEESDSVVKNHYNDSYESTPVSFDNVSNEWIVTDVASGGPGHRPTDGFLTYDVYQFPDVQIGRAGRVSVSSVGVSQQLQPSAIENYQLPPETVGLLAENVKDETKSVSDNDLNTVVDVPVVEQIEASTRVTPSLTVHNHGTLDVVVASKNIVQQRT